MPGVVTIPHGWGHDRPAARDSRVAAAHAGVNSNVLDRRAALDPLSGTAVLNGIPVRARARYSSVSVLVPDFDVTVPRAPS